MYKLDAKKLVELCDAYPEWKKVVIQRAVNRRAYFMTIRDDFRNCFVLSQKVSFAKLNYGIKKVDEDLSSVLKGVTNVLGAFSGASSPEVSMPGSPKFSDEN